MSFVSPWFLPDFEFVHTFGVVEHAERLRRAPPPRPLRKRRLRDIFLMSRPPLLGEEGSGVITQLHFRTTDFKAVNAVKRPSEAVNECAIPAIINHRDTKVTEEGRN